VPRMINRVILLVIDGLGVGAMSDAAEYDDAGANTLTHLADAVQGLNLPNLEALGLGHIASVKGVRTMAQPHGCFGRLAFASPGKDSVTGYWEISGVVLKGGGTGFASGLPAEMVSVLEQAWGRKTIGNRVSSMAAMLNDYGDEHLACGAPIVWTDGGRTCHAAVHETVMAQADFVQRCRAARKSIQDAGAPVRLVAHSFAGGAGAFTATAGRKDFVPEPPGLTMLDVLNRSSQIIMGLGKVSDLFSGRGFTRALSVSSAWAAFDETIRRVNQVPRGLLYVSLDLIPTDSAEAAATALQEFDGRLPELCDKLRTGDLVMITSDHGRDLSRPGRMSTREYVPLLVTGPKLAQGVNLGTRCTAADVGQTIVDALRAERLPVGESFLEALRPG
jgi:phosphopentomutase